MGREAVSPRAARARAPPMADPPMPATTRPAGLSHSLSWADSAFHSASRRGSGMASTSVSWSVESICPMVSRSSSELVVVMTGLLFPLSARWSLPSELDRPGRQLRPGKHLDACGEDVALTHDDALSDHGAAADD